MKNRKPESMEWHSQKILPQHLDRLAVVYVRQSTLQQVLDHQESTRLQYGLVERAKAWGWQRERILIIDDDLGKSGATAQGRAGFQRLVAEVGMGHVGLILGIEMSRLARSCKDWHQLLEICALFGTLIADLDGIYDPSHYNDRLLLGLKGTMSEAELHVLKQRLVQGKLSKAERGELEFGVPTGYVRRSSGEVTFDPDEQVQQVIRLIFRKFDELGTLNAVLRYLVDHQIQIGVRVKSGLTKGELEWHRPNRTLLQNILKNPMYAGAYAYGRRQVDPRQKQAGRLYCERVVVDPNDWHVLLHDRFPAYISWQQHQHNLAQLKSNRICAEELGASRYGSSLLVGLLVCGKCGCRMSVNYHHKQGYRYVCCRQAVDYGGERCQSMSGPTLDRFVVEQAMEALKPAALELSLAAATALELERIELNRLWQQRLERAAYEADRAKRHYQLVEPENRLVARHLASEWEAKLQAQQQLQEEYERFCQQQPRLLSDAQRQTIRQLAHNIPVLWHATTTTNNQRKDLLRQILSRVIVNAQGDSEQVQVTLEWIGGTATCAGIRRPVGKLTQLSNYPQLCERLRELAAQDMRPKEIAQQMNSEGFYPPKRRATFKAEQIQNLMRHLGLKPPHQSTAERDNLEADEWWLTDLARMLNMSTVTLYSWIRRGWVKARQQEHPSRRWIVWADPAEIERLRQRREQPTGAATRQHWLDYQKSRLLNSELADLSTKYNRKIDGVESTIEINSCN
ncbi:MAG: hypothetical protein CLLPBCKN_008474 [Chroococcidiopsis cubana SAG 39.79]|uniref:Transposase n=1 Tax=Chroococcidiopsis cubana SAG 39.79 TaxID=388085 RepID=A0AB37U7F8_9CYAN|nr:recombinase family protein [Chroococcidiopsis cubana]MDZ4879036.1 hypothetical protein [Chroococcidiopsis cubana SAG 39.79]RUS93427.1 hypothetical protein DSM107010_72600 [Chroococcidiopsis cubana SAG 39.79]